MKKFLTFFFVTLGVIFFVLICAGAYVWVTDTYGIRSLVGVFTGMDVDITPSAVDKNPMLSPVQEAALEQAGIDPATVPTTISADQEACATAKLGAARVAEIQAGDVPTPLEIATASECFQ